MISFYPYRRWRVLAYFFTFIILLPLLTIGYHSLHGEWENLSHLANTMLGYYFKNSLLIMVGAVLLSLIFALPSAFIVANYRFWGQKTLQWLLCLPLAMPAYLIGYLYTDLLDYSGEFQRGLRAIFGWQTPQDYWFPEIRSLYGASFVLALVLYPYLFLLVRVALLEQSENLIQSAKLLGANRRRVFMEITLPLIRPAIAVGMALIAMETLGDFGTVTFFGVQTLTTAIYDSWLGYHDLGTASQISLFMLLMILGLMWLESRGRKQQRTYQRGYEKKSQFKTLKGWKLAVAYLWCLGLLALAFFIPMAKLLSWTFDYFEEMWQADFADYAINSFNISLIATGVTILIALLLHFAKRLSQFAKIPKNLTACSLQLSSLGYAIPGTVLAIGLISPLAFLDHRLNDLLESFGQGSVGLIFSGSLFALTLAYSIRFMAMAVGSLNTSLEKISPSLDMASQTLGKNGLKMGWKIHFPLLKKGLLTAALMVFIECMKELNATLLLRPFNFDTLATYVFTHTSDEQLERAAMPAVLLVLVGLIPVIWLTRSLLNQSEKER